MIRIVDKNLFDSKANFIVHQTNCQGVMGSGVAYQVATNYPHVEAEYLKYLRHCKKNKITALGTAQYVPKDFWAVSMVDTMNGNTIIDYDENYQYIVNLFGQEDYGYNGQYTSVKHMKNAMVDIREKAEMLNASIAMPYKIGSYRGGADWNEVYNMIEEVFANTNIDVEICRMEMD